MKDVVRFFEKPNCIGNDAQKKQLIEAGYELEVIDMIRRKWTEAELKPFFGSLDLHECVNPRAPRITSGEVDPSRLNDAELMAAMLADPMLIRRPLLVYGDRYAIGFKNELVTELLGIEQDEAKCGRADEDVDCEPSRPR